MRARALRQAVALGIALALAAAGVALLERRPAQADALHAELSVLRSQAGDTVLLVDAAPDLPARFVRAHAEQAHEDVARERDRIAGLDVVASLETAKRAATRAADALARLLVQVGSGGADASAAEVLRREVEQLEDALAAAAERS